MAYPLTVKAMAMADLLTGEAVSVIARKYHVPARTVRRWAREAYALLGSI